MGGTRGTPVGFTPQTSGLVQRGGGGISTLPVTSTPPATVPAATPAPLPAATPAPVTPMPSVSPTLPSGGNVVYGQTGMLGGGLSGTPAASNKGGGLASTPSPTFASDPVVAQPLPPVPQFQSTARMFPPIVPQPAPPIVQQGNKGGGQTASPSQGGGLKSIPLAPYGSPTDSTATRDITDITELSKTNFDPELTSRDTLRRLDAIDKRFADEDAEKAAAQANQPSAAEQQRQRDEAFSRDYQRYQRQMADGQG
tara:strand:- start:519 stop:1280 length:762 start_codon:yes stop_codon:yes gene_type:complete